MTDPARSLSQYQKQVLSHQMAMNADKANHAGKMKSAHDSEDHDISNYTSSKAPSSRFHGRSVSVRYNRGMSSKANINRRMQTETGRTGRSVQHSSLASTHSRFRSSRSFSQSSSMSSRPLPTVLAASLADMQQHIEEMTLHDRHVHSFVRPSLSLPKINALV